MFHWATTPKPIVALAPMAGVTDASYRQFIKSIAPDVIVYTEFLSTDAIAYGAERTLSMLEFNPALERPFIVQIFGSNPEHFIASCKIIEEMGADGIDINMGCPAAKVVSSCHGSALIRRADLAAKLVEAAVSAVSIPVSVKTRLGWETSETLIPFCKKLVEAGASAFSIHGRTYKEKFGGEANWDSIYALKREISVPVIGNGDVRTVSDAKEKIGNLDGVMVGRATLGNPWLLREIMDTFRAGQSDGRQTPQSLAEKVPFILHHCELSVRSKGEKRGILEMRRHLSGYVRGIDGAKEKREQLMHAVTLKEVEGILCGV